MKKALKIILSVVITIYLIVIVFTTAFLLNRNDYGVSSFLGRYLLLVEDKEIEGYESNTLLFIKPVDNKDIEVGQNVFFYDTYSTDHLIKYSEVTRKEDVTETETTYTFRDNSSVSSQYVLGTKESTSAHHFLGQILYVLQSKWGFLFLVVFPLFLAFIYEIYAIYKEIKKK